MNLPNKLTLTRILLVPVFMIFVSLGQYITPSYNPRYYLIAGLIFAAAASPTSSTAIWPASGTWSPTSASSPTRWPTSC